MQQINQELVKISNKFAEEVQQVNQELVKISKKFMEEVQQIMQTGANDKMDISEISCQNAIGEENSVHKLFAQKEKFPRCSFHKNQLIITDNISGREGSRTFITESNLFATIDFIVSEMGTDGTYFPSRSRPTGVNLQKFNYIKKILEELGLLRRLSKKTYAPVEDKEKFRSQCKKLWKMFGECKI